MAKITERGAWQVLRILDPIANDPDWAATQDVAAVKATDPVGFDEDIPRLGVVSVRVEWYDVSDDKVAGRGSFDLQPTELTRHADPLTGTGVVETVTDSPIMAPGEGYVRYDLTATDGSQGFTVRLSNIVPPGGATKAIVWIMVT